MWAFDNQSWKVSSLNIEISKSHAFLKMYSVDTAHGCQHHVPRIIDKNMVTSKLREVNKTNCMSFYSQYFSSVSIKNSCSSQHITRLLVMCQKSHTMLLGRCILIRYVWTKLEMWLKVCQWIIFIIWHHRLSGGTKYWFLSSLQQQEGNIVWDIQDSI